MNWRAIPFIRILAPFIPGVLTACFFNSPFYLSRVALLLLIFLLILALLVNKRFRFKVRWSYGLVMNISLFLLGFLLLNLRKDINAPRHYKTLFSEKVFFVAQIEKMSKGDRSIRLDLEINACLLSDSMKHCSGRLLAYLPLSSKGEALETGDLITFQKKPKPIRSSGNPKAFDFAAYMQWQNYYFSVYLKETDWVLLKRSNVFSLKKGTEIVRTKCIGILKKYLPEEKAFGVGAALVLGYKQELDDELKKNYAITGAMHVLAVSGLHIGFIYLLFNFIFKLVKIESRAWKFLKTMFLIVIIWSFALITGASPSVCRAATMFSFIILAQSFNRYTNIYNTLAASAFLLLCINPFFIGSTGFLLSYSALIGIIYFQRKIYALFLIKNKIADYLWKLVSLSIAAQLTTFPLSLYFFHQFPFYFWLSGLVVVPLAGIILGAGIAVLFFDAIPFLGMLAGKILYGSIYLLNTIIHLIRNIPGADLLNSLWISLVAVVLLYLVLLTAIAFSETKKPRLLLASLLGLLLIMIAYVVKDLNSCQQKEMVIYQIYQHSAIDIIDGKTLISLHDKTLSKAKLEYANGAYHHFKKVKNKQSACFFEDSIEKGFLFYKENFLQAGNVRLAIINQGFQGDKKGKIKVDYVLLSHNPWMKISDLKECLDFKTIVFDASNYPGRIKKWKEECKRLQLNFHDVSQAGALIIDCKKNKTNETFNSRISLFQ